MIPTSYLRFINAERRVYSEGNSIVKIYPEKRLQQWWIAEGLGEMDMRCSNPTDTPNRGEWRDVPLEV